MVNIIIEMNKLCIADVDALDKNMTPDIIQCITNTLCYGFQRCTKAVHIPAPVYYADLIADRGRSHLRNVLKYVTGINYK
jgi:hypothetical protein